MASKSFLARSEIDVDPETLFRWHARPGAFVRLVPPWERIELEGRPAELRAGSRQASFVRLGPVRRPWNAEIVAVTSTREDPGTPLGFVDRQLQGPFRAWRHEHRMLACDPPQAGRSVLQDAIEYTLPFSPWSDPVVGRAIRRRLEKTFAYRHRVTAMDLKRHAAFADAPPLDVLISGASGLLGSALSAFLTTGGHRVRRLVRRRPQGPDEFRWDALTGEIDPGAAEGADAVVHLAGESIASGRWTRLRKDRLRRSRIEGTRHVADAIRAAHEQPRTLLSASAVGYYGERGDEVLDESSTPGTGFLADLCSGWETQCSNLGGIRTAQLRFGVILSPAGGALRKMLLPFRLGLGGALGTGEQWMSWVALDDAVGAVYHALRHPELAGPVNVVAPHPVTNADYTKALGAALRRPTVLPMPAFAARLAFGEMADELLLASQRVQPRKLLEAGFAFEHPEIGPALAHLLGT